MKKKTASSIKLSPDQIGKLNGIAATLNTLSRTGPTSGNPSWRVLVAEIADGRLTVKDPRAPWVPRQKKGRERKPFKAHPRFSPRWWKPTPTDDMPTDLALEESKYTLDELLSGGLIAVDDGKNLIAPPEWSGWAWKEGA